MTIPFQWKIYRASFRSQIKTSSVCTTGEQYPVTYEPSSFLLFIYLYKFSVFIWVKNDLNISWLAEAMLNGRINIFRVKRMTVSFHLIPQQLLEELKIPYVDWCNEQPNNIFRNPWNTCVSLHIAEHKEYERKNRHKIFKRCRNAMKALQVESVCKR